MSLYHLRPNGQSLNMSDPTVVPRLLTFLSPAVAVSGLGLLLAGAFLRRWERGEEGRAFQVLGLRSFLVGLAAIGLFGTWFLARIPADVLGRMEAMPSVLPVASAGALLFLVAAIFGSLATRTLSRSCLFSVLALVTTAGGLAAVVILRDLLRIAWLQPYFSPAEVPVHPQWTMFFLFSATLVLGLVLVIALTVAVVRNLVRGYGAAGRTG